jgi:hypothetical protein
MIVKIRRQTSKDTYLCMYAVLAWIDKCQDLPAETVRMSCKTTKTDFGIEFRVSKSFLVRRETHDQYTLLSSRYVHVLFPPEIGGCKSNKLVIVTKLPEEGKAPSSALPESVWSSFLLQGQV